MSYRIEKVMSLTGMEILGKSTEELQELFNQLIKRGTHGLCISPYEEGQKPGDQLTEEQIVRRLDIIKPHTKWIRSFSCTDGNELIPRIAKEKGFNTLVGAWLGTDAEVNRREIESVIQLAKEGLADIVAVGNEVLYRGDLSEQELLEFILHVKKEIPDTPVGYVDAYYEFEFRTEITEACDVILANCYPFWEGCSLEYSLLYMKDMYSRAVRAGNGKKVIITETGWPSAGKLFHGAQPSCENALKYFINAQQWSEAEEIEMFYFSSFDESWKTDSEGDVGSTWGLWDLNEQLKF
ncbi:MAG: glycosyl hydrolase [Kiritimatiellales bacterium]|nr:glycosyl hydrolase [Kiritimatiellales bacterium]